MVSWSLEFAREEDLCLADWTLDAAGRLSSADTEEGPLGRGCSGLGVWLVAAVSVDEDVDRAADGAVLGW